MSLLADLLDAAWRMGLPVALLSFGMVWWALRRGFLKEEGNLKSLHREIDALRKAQRGEDAARLNPLHAKWFKFGGGFYGITALYTYLLIEWDEILELLGSLGDLVLRFDISVLISFFIASITNFIGAVTWPLYWMSQSQSGQVWIWFVVAYGGYWLGMSAALRVFGAHRL
jgi:hypothetical protein